MIALGRELFLPLVQWQNTLIILNKTNKKFTELICDNFANFLQTNF